MGGGTSDEGEEGLDEAEADSDEAEEGVGVGVEGLAEALELPEDEDCGHHGEQPGQGHQGPVPQEPLVQPTAPKVASLQCEVGIVDSAVEGIRPFRVSVLCTEIGTFAKNRSDQFRFVC